MEGIRIVAGGKKLLFAATGDVADVSGGHEVTKGNWRSASDEKDNKIRYTLDGAEQAPIQALYSFNKNNQLVVKLRADAGDSKPFTFMGGIEVDRQHNLNYALLDASGNETGVKITIYGALGFEETTNNLVVSLADGGEAAIKGASGVQSLETAKNHVAAFKADDLLTFHAVTSNPVEGQDEPVDVPALLDFAGTWDIQDGTLVFLSKIKGSPDKPEIALGFAGQLGAVTAGFVYYADGKKKEIALNIRGRHVFKSAKAQTDFSWETSLGFSEKKFEAKVDVKSSTNTIDGQTLNIDGSLTLQQEKGGPLKLDLSLQARYSFENGILVFKADISNGIQPSYDLMLEGVFTYSNLKLNFLVRYTNKAGARKVAVAVGVQGNRESIIKNLSLLFEISESEAKLKLELSFEARIRFVNGVRVKELPAAA